MSTDIVPFEFGGEQLRTAGTPDSPRFVAKDVLAILGVDHTSLRRLDEDEKGWDSIPTLGGVQEMLTVTESGLYSLVLGSRKPEAKDFKRWVTGEVLPAIRKTGSYSAPKSLEERTLELVGELHAKVQEQAAEIVELKPLASQARTFNKAKGNVGRQKFARGIVNWAIDNGYNVNINQVYEFMGGKKLDLFVHGVGRSDHGHASTAGLRRSYSVTDRGESPFNGHPYEQGKLTPAGYEYAWSRIETYVREHGHLELPKKESANV